ncbi:MAG: UDP-N-acetylmuramoyl-L-alanine--D-glutamate ligase [Clostridiales bacterium]|jgi:UDP-N-acetylmuramoylalanine--D-glutamate ligase|nr:UDP-N-acetylmuramoyl-L-alanine--D-glutamate ligase [Clostridiales bacterium]
MDFNHKKVLVCGIARSGVAAAKLLKDLGAEVTLQDLKIRDKIEINLDEMEKSGFEIYVGKNPDDIIDDFDLAVISPGISVYLPFVEKALKLGIPVWGEIELAYSLCPCPVIAVTGTNGKTTTTSLIGDIVKRYNPKVEVVGNIGVPFAAKLKNLGKDSCVVAEISSFQLETIHAFKPKVSAILNITPDHIDRHKSMENYIAAKESIGKNQQPDDYMVLNYDDAYCRRIKTNARRVFFSRLEQLEEGFFLDGNIIRARFDGEDRNVLNIDDMQIFGNHSIENTLAAVAAAACMKIPYDVIKEAAESFKAVEHRIEFVRELHGIRFYNDSKATNTDAAIKAIEAMRQPIVLIGGGYDKQSDFGGWVKAFQGKVKHVIVLGEVAEKIMETCLAYNYTQVERVNTLKDAVDLAYGKASPGDCVLLSPACASWDMFENFEQRGMLFKKFVNDLEE